MTVPGTYKHYKGGLYKVKMIGKHTETGELLVIYEDSKNNVWIRPKEMFESDVEFNGEKMKRFTKFSY